MRGFGSYLNVDSVIHRLHPGVKLSALLILVSAILLFPSIYVVLLSSALFLLPYRLAHIPGAHGLKLLQRILPLLLIVFLIRLLLVPGAGEALWEFFFIRISRESLADSLLGTFRLLALVLLFALFARTTSQNELAYGIEALSRPLEKLKIPAGEFSLVMIIAFRFLPLTSIESERLIRAQSARGANFDAMRGGLFSRARAFLPVLIPLFVATLKRCETMATAIEARCYQGGAGRSRLIRYHLARRDLWALLLTVMYIGAGFFLVLYV
ncbi:MAG TPA: energy-coupling factor transporter transmembrane protein EcfT [Sediminispirochaeta sp.]|nr:energy-coupling factor transporter transmembrane protein EcfT [Sediminispirochaeta sp.]